MSGVAILSAQPDTFERRALSWAAAAAVLCHLLILSVMIITKQAESPPQPVPAIVADFAYYDPEGGVGGSSDNDVVMEETFRPAQSEILAMEEITSVEPEPEEEEIPAVVESVSEKAAPAPVKPKVKKEKKQEKPNEQSQSAQDYRAGSVGATGDSLTAGGGGGIGRGGTGGGRGRGNPDRMNAYITQIQRKLNRYKKYPPEAKSQGLIGQVKVSFVVDREGQVISPRLVESSGYRSLDNEVMALLKRISPVPAIPPELNRSSLSLTIPVVFSLN
ncbi:MAG: energy transducer TonB [Deltaproteobacteria bacterium]|jgi:protein TonB|nr:energy transducer TonB [Deltaproteobacteria bacterium]